MTRDLHMSREVAILGVSLYVLGFGLGYVCQSLEGDQHAKIRFVSPLVFAPMSEVCSLLLIYHTLG